MKINIGGPDSAFIKVQPKPNYNFLLTLKVKLIQQLHQTQTEIQISVQPEVEESSEEQAPSIDCNQKVDEILYGMGANMFSNMVAQDPQKFLSILLKGKEQFGKDYPSRIKMFCEEYKKPYDVVFHFFHDCFERVTAFIQSGDWDPENKKCTYHHHLAEAMTLIDQAISAKFYPNDFIQGFVDNYSIQDQDMNSVVDEALK
jgi:hypothetical protein